MADGLGDQNPKEIRSLCRNGQLDRPTAGAALGFVQANLVVLPQDFAVDFEAFCRSNPKPCPLLEVTKPGCAEPPRLAPGADLRRDLPRYRVYRNGACTDHPTDITPWWQDDFVSFDRGSFTFEAAMLAGGLPVRHIELGCNVPMFRTSIACEPAGPFSAQLVVSMRPMSKEQVDRAVKVSGQFPKAHGKPIHAGDPRAIGIEDISQPDFGDAVDIRENEVPVFWACGVTPILAVVAARPAIAITHEPGHMFVTDLRDEALRRSPSTESSF